MKRWTIYLTMMLLIPWTIPPLSADGQMMPESECEQIIDELENAYLSELTLLEQDCVNELTRQGDESAKAMEEAVIRGAAEAARPLLAEIAELEGRIFRSRLLGIIAAVVAGVLGFVVGVVCG